VILRRGRVVELGATRTVFSDPRHAYTRMLLDSVPQLNAKWTTGRSLAESEPADEACGPLVEVSQGHFVASEAS